MPGFTYDPNSVLSDVETVRLLCQDTDVDEAIFSDAEIGRFLTLRSGSVLRAAAMALDVMATNQAIVLKVIRQLDLTTDGASVARALRESAKQLREEADAAEVAEDGGFEVAEFVLTPWQRDYRIWTEMISGS